jgi:hypothetical protein
MAAGRVLAVTLFGQTIMNEANYWGFIVAAKSPIWTRRMLDQCAVEVLDGLPSVTTGINGRLWTFSDGSHLFRDNEGIRVTPCSSS